MLTAAATPGYIFAHEYMLQGVRLRAKLAPGVEIIFQLTSDLGSVNTDCG